MALDLSGGTGQLRPGTQILLWCRRERRHLEVAGLPLWKRAVYGACRAGFERLLVVTDGEPGELRAALTGDHRLEHRDWDVVAAGEDWAGRVAGTGGRWVAMSEEWIVDADLLASLAATHGAPAAVASEGPLAADAEEIARWSASGWNPRELPRAPLRHFEPRPPVFVRVSSAADARAAEDALFRSLARNVNNFFARTIDRPMSRAISRRLAPYPVTPNQITIFSIGLGVVGSLVLLHPSYFAGVLGTFLFFASTVIDGCDGEIARLKFQESAWGAKLDVIGDNVVHAFLFPCLALRMYFSDPGGPFLALGAIALSGVVVTWIAVYVLIVRSDPSPAVRRVFETFANREFAYLVLALGIAGRLGWFVWAMAFGLWIFPVTLVGLAAWERLRAG